MLTSSGDQMQCVTFNLCDGFDASIQALKFLFHSVVEKPVDNYVDKRVKHAIVALLYRIA